jgi:Fe-S-cluster containining protein
MPELLEALLFRTRTFNQLLGAGRSDAEIELALHRYFALGLPCVFLGEGGLCAVHAIRPLTCRMFFSLSDPRFCAAEHLETPKNQGLIVYLPEDIEEAMAEVSAQFEAWELPESLYAGLEKMNAHENIF